MKRCEECNAVYEDSFDICPTCGSRLDPFTPETRRDSHWEENNNTGFDPNRSRHSANNSAQTNDSYTFERADGNRIIINGAVAESNTQQYYQSKLTKVLQALISGEPYQFSHTTFVTIFRVEEHTQRGYPEYARDITLYGNMQNVFAIGDDVTVEAKQRGSRYIAKRIYNHTINSDVRIQPNLPASIIRFIALSVFAIIASLIYLIATADYGSIAGSFAGLLSSFLPAIVIIGLVVYLIKTFFKKK